MDNTNIQDSSQKVQSFQPTQPAHPNHHARVFIYGIAALLLISITLSLGYYLGINNNREMDQNAGIISTNVTTTPKPPFNSEYRTTQHDITKEFFTNTPYPKELTTISDENLVGMKCSKLYLNDYADQDTQPFTYYDEILQKSINLEDNRILQLIQPASKTVSKGQISTIQSCETKDNKYILIYSMTLSGGGAGRDTYFALVNQDNTLGNVVTIPSEKTAYFMCQQPLQLTTSGLFYYECGGGDGPSGSKTIYEVDLEAKTYKSVITCSATVDTLDKPVYSCK